jgi:ATPase subunit of ABC transporter with duplicated ATPase domains
VSVADGLGKRASGGGKDGASASVSPSIDSLQPGTSLKDLSDDAFAELVREMHDGPGRVDTFMQFFGLARCKGTWVGNQLVRGVSGGERKRLSTVEMLMGCQQVLLLDEISTGLVRAPRCTPASLSRHRE